jgi:pentatricopeptide repeat protein
MAYFISTLRDYGAMDLFTYHTLMMGHTKLGRHHRVLALYEEALSSSAQVLQYSDDL